MAMQQYGLLLLPQLLNELEPTPAPNTTNSSSTPTPVPKLANRTSDLVTDLNFFLSSIYSVLLVVTLALFVFKLWNSKMLRVGLIYLSYIFALCFVRVVYLTLPGKAWVKVILIKGRGSSYMSFIDLLPELLFISIFLLSTVMWGIAWAKTRKVKIFKEHLVIYVHSGIVVAIMLISIFLSVAIKEKKIKYSEVILWEAYYVITLSGVAVIFSALLGGLLFHTFRVNSFQQEHTNKLSKRHMRQLLAILILTTISFILKGVWNLVIGSEARNQWKHYEMSNEKFGTLWFFYYFLTELLPLSLSLFQQWYSEIKNKEMNTNSRSSASKNSKKRSTESKDEDSTSASMSSMGSKKVESGISVSVES